MEANQGKSCCICSQIAGDSDNDLISVLLQESDYTKRVICENSHFVVFPSLGALVEGHVIVCPKRHVKSFALLDPEELSSYSQIKQELLRKLRKVYNQDVHLFEHGSAKNSDRIVCTVDHAHIHLIPNNVDISEAISQKYSWSEIDTSSEAFREQVSEYEYLYYRAPNGRELLSVGSSQPFESQYMRKVFANALNKCDHWNWRDFPQPELTDKIFKVLATVI